MESRRAGEMDQSLRQPLDAFSDGEMNITHLLLLSHLFIQTEAGARDVVLAPV